MRTVRSACLSLALVACMAQAGAAPEQKPRPPVAGRFLHTPPVTRDASRPVARPVSAAPTTPPAQTADGEYEWVFPSLPRFEMPEVAVPEGLVVGTRFTLFRLMDRSSDSFIGSLTRLSEIQDPLPYKVFVGYRFTDNLGAELTWDAVSARTHSGSNPGDGDFCFSGPIATAVWRQPVGDWLFPYAGLGAGYMRGDFEAEPWWAFGYASRDEWVAMGEPESPSASGRVRSFGVDSALALVLTAGLDVEVADCTDVGLYVRYMDFDADVDYRITENGTLADERFRTVPMGSIAYGAGCSYRF